MIDHPPVASPERTPSDRAEHGEEGVVAAHDGPRQEAREHMASAGAQDVAVLTDSGPSEPSLITTALLVDPAVSLAKFTRELAVVRARSSDLRRRGWWVLDATFPNVIVAYVSAVVQPRAVIFAARINFDNYDLWAPSVRIVDPFTAAPLRAREIPPTLTFNRPKQTLVQIPGVGDVPAVVDQPLLLTHGPDELPFFCIPGVREYHEHPAHSGDDWFLHRHRGEGTLYFLLEKLARYGLESVRGLQYQIAFSGYAVQPVPE